MAFHVLDENLVKKIKNDEEYGKKFLKMAENRLSVCFDEAYCTLDLIIKDMKMKNSDGTDDIIKRTKVSIPLECTYFYIDMPFFDKLNEALYKSKRENESLNDALSRELFNFLSKFAGYDYEKILKSSNIIYDPIQAVDTTY